MAQSSTMKLGMSAMAGPSNVIVLDGGMGDELRQKFPQKAWSPYALETHGMHLHLLHHSA